MPRLSVRSRPATLLVGIATAVVMTVAVGCSATGTGSGPSGQTSPQAVTIPAQDGPGVTADTITLSWGKALHPTTGTSPDVVKNTQAGWKAVVDAFNEEGGIAGRKVEILQNDPGSPLVAQRSEAYTRSNFLPVPDPTNGKAACDAYAGSQVFALLWPNLVSAPYGTPAAGACLNAGGHPIIGATGWTKADYQAAPSTAGLTIATDRFSDAIIAAGKDSGMLAAPAKTAVITDSAQPTDTLTKVDLPALAKVGVTDPQVFPVGLTLDQAGALNLAVKMKSAGIERVILLSPDAQFSFAMALALVPIFQQQQFTPKVLGISGLKYEALAAAGNVGITPQIAESLLFYQSQTSTDALELNATQAATPGGKLYNAVVQANPALQPYIDVDLCDALELLKAALAASGSKYVNAQSFTTGLDKLQDTYQSLRLFATSFGPGRHDGGAGIVRQTYSSQCQCGQVSSNVQRF
jgi:hypothetical protein